MKNLFLIIAFAFFSLFCQSQNNYQYLHGLEYNKPSMKEMSSSNKNNRTVYFEMSGVEIAVSPFAGNINKKNVIKKIKNKHKIKNTKSEYSVERFSVDNLVLETETEINKNVKSTGVYYLLQTAPNQIHVFRFFTLNQRNDLFEQNFIQDYLDGKLEEYISNDWSGEYIHFLDRYIPLGNACHWNSPHNFYCIGGQISWSEFSSLEEAETDMKNRIAANEKKEIQILSKDLIYVEFLETPTIAFRFSYLEKNNIRDRKSTRLNSSH